MPKLKQKLTNNHSRQPAFTLIETVTALFIFSLGILSIIIVFPFASNKLNNAEFNTQATFLAQAKIEDLIAQPYEQVAVGQVTENSLGGNFSNFSRLTTVNYVDANLNLSVSDMGLKKIIVIVKTSSTTPLSYQLVTLITEH